MALFKSLRGKRENLPSSKTDGYAYFCTDDGTFWIDYTDDSGVVQRKQINAKDAETFSGMTKAELQSALDLKSDKAGAVPTTRTINEKALSSDIVLTPEDIGATPSTHAIDTTIHITQDERTSWNAKATIDYVDDKVAGIVNSAPETLDTLNELAAALGNDANFSTTVTTLIGTKVDKVDGKGLSTNDYTTKEKEKLAGIEEGANKYILPVANSSTLGGIKSGTDITVDSVGNVSINDDSHNHIISNIDGLQDALDAKVPTSRTVNGKALSSNITLAASDVGAVPTSRKVNGKALSSDITLSASDIGLGNVGDFKAVSTVASQGLTDTEKSNARANIGAAPASHTSDSTIHVTSEEKTAWNAKADASFKPEGKSYLTFSSPSSFTLNTNDKKKHWDGTLEYFTSNKTWYTWYGTTTLSSVNNDGEHVLYLRGTGNTVITGNNNNYKWKLTGTDIKCIGNIENLLDYATVESGEHPTMADYCYSDMFYQCTSLTQAPALPATALTSGCYKNMFSGCDSLAKAPALPATTLTSNCYHNMFRSCDSITQAPALPATTLASECYRGMFLGCALTKAPALPVTTLADGCYYEMFSYCANLAQAPILPATTLASECYRSMFSGCDSLAKAPNLPATTLANNCYLSMFSSCDNLTQVPDLPATELAEGCYKYMFQGCTSLKLSTTKTGEYMQEYRVPSSGTGTTATNSLTNMFSSTGGTFTGTPEINTNYYLSSNNMVVRETEVATLNGYVSYMIDAAIGNAIGGSY